MQDTQERTENKVQRNFTRIVNIGLAGVCKGKRARVYIKIEYKDGRLSIIGVHGALVNGDCLGGYGQIVNTLKIVDTPAVGVNLQTINKIVEIWERWHLNDMNAGTVEQEEYLRNYYRINRDVKKSYGNDVKLLKEVSLYIVDHPKNKGETYTYGTGWLTEEVPDNVIEFLYWLPESETKPAWI
jgi:hypothetical protein